MMSPALSALTKLSPSVKEIHGLAKNVFYKALSADAKTKMGLAPKLTIHDELGQVVGPQDDLYDALETAGGAYNEPLSLIISTQAPTSADLLSLLIDDALRSGDPRTVCHLFSAPEDCVDIFDEKVWYACNPALGIYRDVEEFREAAQRAKRMPSFESAFRNLYLNMRTARESLAFAPLAWKACAEEPVDEEVFYKYPVSLGIDLSSRVDLTAIVIAAVDDESVLHLKTLCFTPSEGLEERAKNDRVPYPLFVKQGLLYTVPGRVVDYQVVAQLGKDMTAGMDVENVAFDRWRMDIFKKEADEVGFAPDAKWQRVGQGFLDMSPRLENFEARLLQKTVRHGNHPLLNAAAAGAIAVRDPANNRKLEKSKSSARIDALVAAIMATAAADGLESAEAAAQASNVTESSLFFVGGA